MAGGASITSGSRGPPRPIETTTTLRSRASRRATWPVTAVVRQLRERVAHPGRVVLAVDQRERPHCDRVVTSPSILAVYFSNASVSVETWMIRSCPWNGYFRQTDTWWSQISITL